MSGSHELYVDIPALREVPKRFYNLKKQAMEKVALLESSEKYLRFHLSGSEELCAEVRRIQRELEGICGTFEQMGQVLETICDLYAACESKEAEVAIQLKKKDDVPWYQSNTFKWVVGAVVVVGAGVAAAEGLVSSGIYMADAYYDGGQPTADGVVLSFGAGTAAVVGGAVLAPAITNIKKAVVGAVEKSLTRDIEKKILNGTAEEAAGASGKTAAKSTGEGGKASVQHAVGSANQAQSVLDGIEPKYFNAESRFGKGFYVGGDGKTIVAELAEHGNTANYAISYDMNLSGQKVLDLTNPQVALQWDYISKLTSTDACKEIGTLARIQGYDVIIFQSYRGDGINYVVYSNFDDILMPRIVTPID